ncbi:hypothetical protein PENTCL1PPCAC_10802, partial [Pristionchus entomophagus]
LSPLLSLLHFPHFPSRYSVARLFSMAKSTEMIIVTEITRPSGITEGQRVKMPREVPPREGYSLWEIIKPNLGRDFSRFKVPVNMNEPVTMLLAESYMAYIDLVLKAITKESPTERIELIATYAISGLATNRNRLTKPFNPLLLETFEFQKDGCRFMSEQVSNHPPVSLLHVDGPGFHLTATVSPKVSFWMNRLICNPNSVVKLVLTATNEVYHWESPTCTIWNVMLGKPYMNLSGNSIIRSPSTGHEARLNFDSNGMWSQRTTDLHVDGYINHGKTVVRGLYGNWSLYVASCSPSSLKDHYSLWQKAFLKSVSDKGDKGVLLPASTVLWSACKLPDRYEMQYHFTFMTLHLNEMTPPLKTILPPTDSRRRPDMIKLEYGQLDAAHDCKEYVEEAQRARRKEGGKRIKPKWFTNGKDGWTFNTGYWDRKFDECEDIF